MNVIQAIVALSLGLVFCSAPSYSTIKTVKTKEEQSALTPWRALQKLKQGNERFLTATMRQRDLISQVASAKKQHPFAVILSCMDSRGSPEIIFDQGIGDIFAERLAGNVVGPDVLGGMEYGTEVIGAKLVVVLGHTDCGAVKGACDNTELGNLTSLLQKIRPAVMTVQNQDPAMTCNNSNAINLMARQNVHDVLEHIKKESPVLMALVKAGKIGIVGGMHDLTTGRVSFFDDKDMLPGAP